MVRQQSFVFLVVSTVLAGVFLLIYKQTYITQLLYEQQTLEKEHAELLAQKAQFSQQLSYLNNATTVQEYAVNVLGMKKISIKQVHRIDKANTGALESLP